MLSSQAKDKIVQCRKYLDDKISSTTQPLYGVNTGFGSLYNKHISREDLERLQDNLTSLKELAQNVSQSGKRFLDFPLVMQYNKMDLPNALPTPVLDRYLNTIRVPRFEATAFNGHGVFETLRAICNRVTNKL